VLAEVVLVLPSVEQILRQVCFTRQEAKALRLGYGGPEAGSATDRAIAAVGALREIELGLELDHTTVAAASVGFQHVRIPCAYGRSTANSLNACHSGIAASFKEHRESLDHLSLVSGGCCSAERNDSGSRRFFLILAPGWTHCFAERGETGLEIRANQIEHCRCVVQG